ncbi:uncharacterized protein Z518_02504 [Rhinocladiella mackenziei CBS 650.93]|uniref:ATP-dependent RNA helicase n=1 Tax=Rhinocladiella mackenziei CBS 650.93 TaxID=1442369 RepID=A0A0D2JF57_9EURO|nr:uncharacterized protein Z518_02504 [Rhinocladiella mackenziei CBS 650.93]KIX07850.1 hypothetical protein Z518_02504 [Rhinocladiella mackenziei CBS 650.93]
MSHFYARYVPPSKSVLAANASSIPEKCRRDESTASHEKGRKRLKLSDKPDQGASTIPKLPSGGPDTPAKANVNDVGKGVLDGYRVTEAARNANSSVDIKSSKALEHQDGAAQKNTGESKSRKRNKSEPVPNDIDGETSDGTYDKRRASVLSRFEKARVREQDPIQESDATADQPPPPELHGLEPIPQPEPAETFQEKPTYSVLPYWQETPLNVQPGSTSTFESIGVSGTLLANLKKIGLERAFPVQATVLPLLFDGPAKHDGDLCVSAATGSGKTLTYILPMIADLMKLAGTKLRAVIVVPTRELVKQVRELCEICASGTHLKIATAVGSKSLKDEQEMLVEEGKVYDLERYQKQQRAQVDWSRFSLRSLVQRAKSEDPLKSVGYVTRYRSKADILITTPGRLVDHLQSTSGFTLDDVRWLAVDEADRLLNESYQEWIEVVIPALESRAATMEMDELLRFMKMTPPRRKLIKILLSATMTRDVSKLNEMGLYNPKLVLLGSSDVNESTTELGVKASPGTMVEHRQQEGRDAFHLPPSLEETAIPIPDGSEKPLYLVELLRQYIGLATGSQSGETLGSSSICDSGSDSELSTSPEDDDSSSSDGSSRSGKIPKVQAGFLDQSVRSRQANGARRALVFVRSTAAATRLSRLLVLLSPAFASQISTLTRSTVSSASSRRALSAFRNSKISILIATDRASRGLDVPGLEHVISYDVPNSALTYVHRVGRTARAGRAGHAWTIIEHREAAWFWREIGGKGKNAPGTGGNDFSVQRQAKIKRLNLSIERDALKTKYGKALQQLGEEARGK